MSYKISVIIPTYNAEDYLMETIDSLINQTIGFDNIETILIDDCSSDNTRNILKDLNEKYSNVKTVFLEKNHGSPSKARNEGIKNSSSDYIMFLDSDDLYTPEMCEVMYNTIVKNDGDMVCCRYTQENKYSSRVPYFFLDDFKTNKYKDFKGKFDEENNIIYLKSYEDFPEIMSLGCPSMIWNKIFKRDVIINSNIEYPENDFFEDVYFTMKFYLNAKNLIFLNGFFGYEYQLRNEDEKSISQNFSKSMLLKQLSGFLKIMDFLEKEDKDFNRLKSELIIDMTKIYMYADIEKDCQNKFLNIMKPYYKNYKITTRVNTASLPLNLVINIFIKIFSLNSNLAIFIKNLFLKIKK